MRASTPRPQARNARVGEKLAKYEKKPTQTVSLSPGKIANE